MNFDIPKDEDLILRYIGVVISKGLGGGISLGVRLTMREIDLPKHVPVKLMKN